jgi:hypothetical protein
MNKLTHFRESLFWDIDPAKLDVQKHKTFIVSRVMHRGKLKEWKQVEALYGKNAISKLLPEINWQDPKTEAFFKLWYGEK